MAAVNESFLHQSWHRVAPLKPRLRTHLGVHRHRYRGVSWYVIEDKASGRIHRFSPAAYLFVAQMDGRRTVDEIWTYVVGQLGDDAPTQGDVIQLLAQLSTTDLLQSDITPDAAAAAERHERDARRRAIGKLANPLAIKFSLFDPDALLTKTEPWVGRVFSRTGAAIWVLTVTTAVVLVAMHWSALTENVADRVLSAESLMMTALVFPVLKLFHEFGHGYATKTAGGEVHEMGVMFLVFAPVPYVDASAASAFRSKWLRALVGAAGMLTELFIAALATLLWVYAEPGIVRSIAFQTMFIAGVSTVVFNINPLLRFDGYYILCDILEMPNLGTRSTRFWRWLGERLIIGPRHQPLPIAPGERLWLVLYAPLAFVYRIFVLFGIALFVASSFFVIGAMLALWGVIVGLVLPIAKALIYITTSPQLQAHRAKAVTVTGGALACLLVAGFLIPVPLHSVSEGVIWLPEESYIRAADSAFIKSISAKQHVVAGDVLIETEEPEVSSGIRVLQAHLTGLQRRLESEQFADRVQADITRQQIAVAQANFDRLAKRDADLRVRSPYDGVFLVPNAEDLPGRYVKRGDILGYLVYQPSRIARVVVSQDHIELVRNQFKGAEVRFADRPSQTFAGSVVREIPGGTDRLPSKALAESGGGRFAADPRDNGQSKTLERTFQFDISLPMDAANSNFGSRVFVRFDHGSEPIVYRWARAFRGLFLSHFGT